MDMSTPTPKHFLFKRLSTYIALGTASIIASFAIGIQTAGDLPSAKQANALEASLLKPSTATHVVLQDALRILALQRGMDDIEESDTELDKNADGYLDEMDIEILLTSIN